ncbi:glycosyltransferase family 2 protein [Cesiribacter andamanensis]|uniref:Spore coat polysaccharide biosynthesis protein spsA n=1 Tax=Cesiribacter andamanensis AMV16 TaxID=1279009 RepID=M7N1A4_9BACT|nr:glycosyltransferase family A protein [Cesiribacter andamanensis]EMR01077.1 Spore coat polysaccharide biosynthesis protein spsA [Cesiribacter andamanensis AMV16]
MIGSATPIVSIITCFLNEERFLKETVESVLAQDYPHWELLLVDDGSSDASTSIARSYAGQHPGKIYYLEHPQHANRGLSASRNAGIARARGELVAFLDADDVWLPQKLSRQVALMQQHPQVAMVCEASEYWFSWEDAQRDDVVLYVGDGMAEGVYAPPQLMLRLYPLNSSAAPCPSGLLCRMQALQRIGGFEAHFTGANQLYEDQGFLAKMYANEPVYVSKGCHNRYRQRIGSLVQSVTEGGKYHQVRRYFLEWLESYLHQQGIDDPQVHKMLRKALRPYRQPLLHYVTSLPQKGLQLFQKH